MRDYEVYSVENVTGFGSELKIEQPFHPFYALHDQMEETSGSKYFTQRRKPALMPTEGS